MDKIDKWLTTIRGMSIVTALAVIVVLVNPLLPWGFQVGGQRWWTAILVLAGGLARLWYVAIREQRAASRPLDAP